MEVATVRSYGRLRACVDRDAGYAAQAPTLERMRMCLHAWAARVGPANSDMRQKDELCGMCSELQWKGAHKVLTRCRHPSTGDASELSMRARAG